MLKIDSVKVLYSICQKIWKTQLWTQEWKRSVFIPIPKKGNAKECSNYCTIALMSHASKEMLKILQARFQQYMNCELSDIQAGFRKGRGTKDQIASIRCSIKKVREFQKNILLLLYWPCQSLWLFGSQHIVESKRGEWKSWLKTQHSGNQYHGIWSHHFMANRWGNTGNSDGLYFGGLQKSVQMVTAAMKLKDACSLEEKLWPT